LFLFVYLDHSLEYRCDVETSTASVPRGTRNRVSFCFCTRISVLSGGGTCARIVEYRGDGETSTASVPVEVRTVFLFVSLQQFVFCLAELHVQVLWSTEVTERRVQRPHQEDQKLVLQ
jgi:hypothetical protein